MAKGYFWLQSALHPAKGHVKSKFRTCLLWPVLPWARSQVLEWALHFTGVGKQKEKWVSVRKHKVGGWVFKREEGAIKRGLEGLLFMGPWQLVVSVWEPALTGLEELGREMTG